VKQSVASFLPFCSSVCFYSIFWTDWTWNLSFVCVWVMTIAHLGLKVKVIGQGQRAESSACGRGKVTRSVWPRFSIEDGFSSYNSAVLRRVEGGVNLGTAVRVWNPCPRQHIGVVIMINTTAGGEVRNWVLSHCSHAWYHETTATLFWLLNRQCQGPSRKQSNSIGPNCTTEYFVYIVENIWRFKSLE